MQAVVVICKHLHAARSSHGLANRRCRFHAWAFAKKSSTNPTSRLELVHNPGVPLSLVLSERLAGVVPCNASSASPLTFCLLLASAAKQSCAGTSTSRSLWRVFSGRLYTTFWNRALSISFNYANPCRLVSLNTLRLINTRLGCIVSPASPRLSSTKTRPHACASFEKQTLLLDLRLDAQIQTLIQVRFDAPYRPASLPAPPSEPPFCAS